MKDPILESSYESGLDPAIIAEAIDEFLSMPEKPEFVNGRTILTRSMFRKGYGTLLSGLEGGSKCMLKGGAGCTFYGLVKSLIVMILILFAARGLTIQFFGHINYGRVIGFAQGYGNTLIDLVRLSFKTPFLTSICGVIDQNRLWASITGIMTVASGAILAFCVAITNEQKVKALEGLGMALLKNDRAGQLTNGQLALEGGLSQGLKTQRMIEKRMSRQVASYMRSLEGGEAKAKYVCNYVQFAGIIGVVVTVGGIIGYVAYQMALSRFEKMNENKFLNTEEHSLLDYVTIPQALMKLSFGQAIGQIWYEIKEYFKFFLDIIKGLLHASVKLNKARINLEKAQLAYMQDTNYWKDYNAFDTLPGTLTDLHKYERELGTIQAYPYGAAFAVAQHIDYGWIACVFLSIFSSVFFGSKLITVMVNAICRIIFNREKAKDVINVKELTDVAKPIVEDPTVQEKLEKIASGESVSSVVSNPASPGSERSRSPERFSPARSASPGPEGYSSARSSPSRTSPERFGSARSSPSRSSLDRFGSAKSSPYLRKSPSPVRESPRKSPRKSPVRQSPRESPMRRSDIERAALEASGLPLDLDFSQDQIDTIVNAYKKRFGL